MYSVYRGYDGGRGLSGKWGWVGSLRQVTMEQKSSHFVFTEVQKAIVYYLSAEMVVNSSMVAILVHTGSTVYSIIVMSLQGNKNDVSESRSGYL